MKASTGRVLKVAKTILNGGHVDGWRIDGGIKGPFATVWTSGTYNIYHDDEIVGRVTKSVTGLLSVMTY